MTTKTINKEKTVEEQFKEAASRVETPQTVLLKALDRNRVTAMSKESRVLRK